MMLLWIKNNETCLNFKTKMSFIHFNRYTIGIEVKKTATFFKYSVQLKRAF